MAGTREKGANTLYLYPYREQSRLMPLTVLLLQETPYFYRQAEDPGYLILFVGGKRFPFAPPLPYL